jgi:hypothetical protein
MDGDRFDSLTRALSDVADRRAVLRSLAGAAIVASALASDADARKKKKKCKKKCGRCEKCVNGKCKARKAFCGTTCFANGACAQECRSQGDCGSGCYCDFLEAHVCVQGFTSCDQVPQACNTAPCPQGQVCIQTGCLPGLRCASAC